MIFNSKVHGPIEYEEKDILTFNKGILGFENLRKFILFHSLEDDELGIIVTSPYDFFEEYKVKLSNDVVEHLGIKKPEDAMRLTTVTLNSDPKKITTNLQGPIVVNSLNNLGEQIIIDNGKYKVKEPLMKE